MTKQLVAAALFARTARTAVTVPGEARTMDGLNTEDHARPADQRGRHLA